MSRTKLLLLCLMATAAASMVASTSAFAEPEFWLCKEVGRPTGKFDSHLCNHVNSNAESNTWATKQLAGAESFEVEGTSPTAILKGEIGSSKVKVTIDCQEDTFKSTMFAGGRTEGEVTFKKCFQTGLGGLCGVHEPIVFKFTDQLRGTQKNLEDEFKPTEAEEVFVELEITGGSCATKGKYKVKGTQTCNVLHPEASGSEHELECTPAGSKNLKLGGNPAEFTNTERFHEVKGWAWGIDP